MRDISHSSLAISRFKLCRLDSMIRNYLEYQHMTYGRTFNFIPIWFTVWSLTKEKVIFAATRSIVVCVISVSRVVTSLSCRASLSDHSLPCFKVLLGLLETLFTFSSTIAWNCSLFKNRERRWWWCLWRRNGVEKNFLGAAKSMKTVIHLHISKWECLEGSQSIKHRLVFDPPGCYLSAGDKWV